MVAHHAHHFHPGKAALQLSELDPFADCAFVRPEVARHLTVDDDDGRRIGAVEIGELPALQNGDAHGLEVSGQ